MESKRRLAFDNRFSAAIQEILQVEDVIFIWRSRGVLNDTIWRIFLSIFTVWRLWISEMRLAVDNGFNSAIQEIIQVEDVIFTWRSRGVLNDAIMRIFGQFSLFENYG